MRKTIALTLFCCFSTSILHAQISLDEIQVLAKSVERKGLNTEGLNANVIPDSVIKANIGSTLSELLTSQTGIVINGSTQTLGSVQTIFFRGASRGLTLILVNGIPVYDASDISQAFDLNSIPLNTIERIEILKGGQSVVYGSDAVAGVINIITKTASKSKFETSTMVGIGSFGTYKFSTNFSGKLKGFSYQIGYSTLSSNGISAAKDTLTSINSAKPFEKDEMSQQVISGIIQQNINNKLSLNANLRYSNYKTGLDGGAFIDDADFISKNKMLQYGLGLNLSLTKGYLVANYLKNNSNRSYLDDSTSVPKSAFSFYSSANYKSTTDFYELYTNLSLNSSSNLLLGIEYQQFKMEQDYLSLSEYGEYRSPEITEKMANLGNTSAYITANYKKNKIGFELGGRLNHASIYGYNTSFVMSPYVELDKVNLIASLARSYKNPSLYQLFSEYGNNALTPQNSLTFDAGAAFNYSNKNTISVGYFNRKIKDLIFFNSIDIAPYGQYINLDSQQEAGLELELTQSFKNLFFNMNYTNLFSSKTILKTTNDKIENIDFLRRPKQVLNASIGYKFKHGITTTLTLQNQSSRKDRFYNPVTFSSETVDLKAFTLLNTIINYQLNKRTQLTFSGNNLLNSKYYETYGFSTRPTNFNLNAVFSY